MRLASLAFLFSCIPGWAGACEAWTFGAGVAMLDPHGGATRADVRVPDRVVTAIAGVPRRFELRGLTASPESARTLALTAGCELSARWTLQLDAGLPPRVAVQGAGTVAPPGPTSALLRLDLERELARSVVDQRVWSPVLALRHRFGAADAPLRPFVSVGASYTWFTDARVRPGFDAAIDRHFGQPLALAALRPGRTRTRVDIDPQWAPVVGLGLEWRAAPRWTLGASLGYSPVRVNAHLRTTAADGSWLAGAHTRSDLEVLGASLVLSYRWRPDDAGG